MKLAQYEEYLIGTVDTDGMSNYIQYFSVGVIIHPYHKRSAGAGYMS